MGHRIRAYRKYIDELLAGGDGAVDWQQVYAQHLVQIQFFQHERLVHLIVTVIFAALEMMSIGLFTVVCGMSSAAEGAVPILGLLCVVILVLLIPYIRHYWILENEVQKMYGQYDEICGRCGYRHFSDGR